MLSAQKGEGFDVNIRDGAIVGSFWIRTMGLFEGSTIFMARSKAWNVRSGVIWSLFGYGGRNT